MQTTGLVDFDQLAERAALFKPAMIICGGSAYPREWEYRKCVTVEHCAVLPSYRAPSLLTGSERLRMPTVRC